jgi:hypothetical protein
VKSIGKRLNKGFAVAKQNQVTQLELIERYKVVQELIVQGYSGADVWRYIESETDWGITRRQAYNYFNDAFEALADESQVNRAAWFRLMLERLEWQYRQAVQRKDWKLARLLSLDIKDFLKLDSPHADFDWKKDAQAAGLNPDEIENEFKRLMVQDEVKSNGHK